MPSRNIIHIVLSILVVLLSFALNIVGISWGIPTDEKLDLLFLDKQESNKMLPRIIGETQQTLREKKGNPIITNIKGDKKSFDVREDERRLLKVYRNYILYSNSPDEILIPVAISRIRPSVNRLNPYFYACGGSYIYPTAISFWIASKLGKLELKEDPAYYINNPREFGQFYVVGRLLVAIAASLAVFVVILLGNKLFGYPYGVVAGLFIAIMPGQVALSHEMKPHAYAVLFVVLALYFAVLYIKSNRLRDVILSGIFSGVAGGAVINYGVAVLFIIFVVIFYKEVKGFTFPCILYSSIAFLLALLITNFYWLLAPKEVISEFLYVLGGPKEPTTSLWLFGELPTVLSICFSPLMLIASIIGAVLLFRSHSEQYSKPLGIIFTIPVIIYIVIATLMADARMYSGQVARFFLFPVPIIAILATYLIKYCREIKGKVIAIILTIVIIIPALYKSVTYDVNFALDSTDKSTRIQAARWINENILPESKIVSIAGFIIASLPPFNFNRFHLLDIDISNKDEIEKMMGADYLILTTHNRNTLSRCKGSLAILDGFEEYMKFSPPFLTPATAANEEFVIYKRK